MGEIDESNHPLRSQSQTTPAKKLDRDEGAVVMLPSSSSVRLSLSSSSSVDSSNDIILGPSSSLAIVPVSRKKGEVDSGQHAVEPLLMENPNRFVLFPIQDHDVSD